MLVHMTTLLSACKEIEGSCGLLLLFSLAFAFVLPSFLTGPSQAACNGHGGSRVPAIRAELFIRLQHGKLLQSAR